MYCRGEWGNSLRSSYRGLTNVNLTCPCLGRLFIQYFLSLSSLPFCPSHTRGIPTEGIPVASVRHLRSSDFGRAESALQDCMMFHTLFKKVYPSILLLFLLLFWWGFFSFWFFFLVCGSTRRDIWYILKVPVTIHSAPLWEKKKCSL